MIERQWLWNYAIKFARLAAPCNRAGTRFPIRGSICYYLIKLPSGVLSNIRRENLESCLFSVVSGCCSDGIFDPIYRVCTTAVAVHCQEHVNAVKKLPVAV